MPDVINFPTAVPEPDDETLEEFIDQQMNQALTMLKEKIKELDITVDETEESGQPNNFAYAKLLKSLNNDISSTQLVHLCAIAMWKLDPFRS